MFTLVDVPPGTIHAFTAGAVQGFLINHEGNLRALSRVCTHMGCTLNFKRSEQAFACPCHGAEFSMSGHLRYGFGRQYGRSLPPLPQLTVRVKGESVQVWSA